MIVPPCHLKSQNSLIFTISRIDYYDKLFNIGLVILQKHNLLKWFTSQATKGKVTGISPFWFPIIALWRAQRHRLLVHLGSKWAFYSGIKFPGSRGFFPGKREAEIRKFPGNSLPGNSREEALPICIFDF